MNPIRMVDLAGQYSKIQTEVDSAIRSVLESTAFINGPEVRQFEEELARFLNVKHVIACANGTDALQIAMMALGLRPGDEVICPDFTFISTNEVVALLQLQPVLVDVDPGSFCIDPEAIRRAITPRTRAIVPVHLFGQCADMEAILGIAREHGLFVIEDTAQALGASLHFSDGSRHMAGSMGDIGCTSFFPSKNLGCYGDGGAIFTNDDQLASHMRIIANHGMKVRYYHDELGINSRLDSIQAAILRIKLRNLEAYNRARSGVAAYYDKAFGNHKDLLIPFRASYSSHIFHQYTLRLLKGDRKALIDDLGKRGVPAMIYYPVAMHHQKPYCDSRYREQDFSVTNLLVEQVFSLPVHTELDEEQLAFISQTVLDILKD